MKRIWILFLLLLCAAACDSQEEREKNRHMVLLYCAGNNSLASDLVDNYNQIKTSWLPGEKTTDQILLIYKHIRGSEPMLVRLSRDRKGNPVETVIRTYPESTGSARAETLRTVIADAEAAWPSARHSLILWSHATGYLPSGYYGSPTDKASAQNEAAPLSFGQDSDTKEEMEITELREALSAIHYELILFDCCFMGNVETAYELRNNCDYLVASAAEIISDGFPYGTIIEPMFSQQAEEAARTLCRNYMEYYRRHSNPYATISLVKTSELDRLAAACRPVFANHREAIRTLDRSQIQAYHRFSGMYWFYDLDDFVGRVATDEEYRTFLSALDRTVLYKDATEMFINLKINHYSGLSVYIPRDGYANLNSFYKTLQWNKATGLVP